MRRLDIKVICCIILVVSCTLCTGAGRRRRPMSPRQNFQLTQPNRLIPTSSSPTDVRRTYSPDFLSHFFRPATPTPTNSPASTREGESKIICKSVHDIFGDPRDLNVYKICVPVGRTWIMYTYRCPVGSQFDATTNKCVLTPTTTTTRRTTTLAALSSSTNVILHSSTATSGTFITDNTISNNHSNENLESSSSSEEDSTATNSPTTSTTTTPASTTTTPKPLSVFAQNLVNLNQGTQIDENKKDRFSILTQILMNTMKPEQLADFKNKFPNFSFGPATEMPYAKSTTNSNQESENVIWESLYKNPNQQTTTTVSPSSSSSITRWKVDAFPSSPLNPHIGRFPPRSPVIT